MSDEVGGALPDRRHARGLLGCLRFGVQDAGLGQCLGGHGVAHAPVAAHARLAVAVGVVIELRRVGGDGATVARQTALVGHLGGVHREARIGREVRVDLTERGDLVREPLGGAGIHVALDAGYVAVRACLPGLVVRGHLVAGGAEGGLVGCLRGCDERDAQHCHHDQPDDDGEPLVTECRGDEASHSHPFAGWYPDAHIIGSAHERQMRGG